MSGALAHFSLRGIVTANERKIDLHIIEVQVGGRTGKKEIVRLGDSMPVTKEDPHVRP